MTRKPRLKKGGVVKVKKPPGAQESLVAGHKQRFEQLLGDAVLLGVKKPKRQRG